MLFKGLTSYPVFVLTLVSLLAISYLAYTVMNDIYGMDTVDNGSVENPVYVYSGGKLYLKTSTPYTHLLEIMIYRNNTEKTRILPRNENGLYGPIFLDENLSRVLIIASSNKPVVIDQLIVKDAYGAITRVYQNPYPPSLILNPREENGLYEAESPIKTNEFYVLKPVTMVHEAYVEKNKTYLVGSESLKLLYDGVNYYLVYNETLEPSLLYDRLNELIDKYGEVVENRRYVLDIYPLKTYICTPKYSYVLKILYSRSFTITTSTALPDIVVDKPEVLLKTSLIHRVLSFTVKDLYGSGQEVIVNATYELILVNSTNTLTENLGYTVFYAGEQPVTRLSKSFIVGRGAYRVSLRITYRAYIVSTPMLPVKVTINQYVYGEGSTYKALQLLGFDKLRLNLDGEEVVLYPLSNETCVDVSIHGSLTTDHLEIGINGSISYVVRNYSITYNGSQPVRVEVYAVPSTVIYSKPYIEPRATSTHSRTYSILDNGTIKVYGVFFEENYSQILLVIYPYILLDNASYTIIYGGRVAGISNGVQHTILVNGTLVNSTDPEFHGFIYVKHVYYEYPVLIYNLTEYQAYVTVRYVDGYTVNYSLSGYGAVSLRNTVVEEVVVQLVLSNSSGYAVLSSSRGYIAYYVVDENTVVYPVKPCVEKILGSSYTVIAVGDEKVIVDS